MFNDVVRIVDRNSWDVKVEYVQDIVRIMSYGVMATPVLVINEKVVMIGHHGLSKIEQALQRTAVELSGSIAIKSIKERVGYVNNDLYCQCSACFCLGWPFGNGWPWGSVFVRAFVLLLGSSTSRSYSNRFAAECGQFAVCDHQLLARQANQLAGGAASDDRGRYPFPNWRTSDPVCE